MSSTAVSGSDRAGAGQPGVVEVRRCQVCGGEDHAEKFREPPYTVLECRGCGLVFVTPRLDEAALQREVYGATYWNSDSPREHGYADYTADAPLYLKTYRRRLRFVRRHVPDRPLRVLDIGCAAGYFLRVMQENGHDVRGVEVSAPIAAKARAALGDDRVHVGTLDSVPDDGRFARGSFDLVTLWDVVEHVPDPQDLLRQARAMLAPGGTLILETQNVASRFAKTLGPRWHHYKHQEHLYHFDPRTIRRVLADSGFDVVQNTASFGGKYVSLGFIAERARRLGKVAAVLLSPLNLFKRANLYLNFRDEMVVVARAAADTTA